MKKILLILSAVLMSFIFVGERTRAQRKLPSGFPKTEIKVIPPPKFEWQKYETNIKDYAGKPAQAAVTFGVSNWSEYSDDLFAPSPELSPCSSNNSAARTFFVIYDYQTDKYVYQWCGLTKAEHIKDKTLYFYENQTIPACIYAILEDRKTGKKYVSNPINVKGRKNAKNEPACVSPVGKP